MSILELPSDLFSNILKFINDPGRFRGVNKRFKNEIELYLESIPDIIYKKSSSDITCPPPKFVKNVSISYHELCLISPELKVKKLIIYNDDEYKNESINFADNYECQVIGYGFSTVYEHERYAEVVKNASKVYINIGSPVTDLSSFANVNFLLFDKCSVNDISCLNNVETIIILSSAISITGNLEKTKYLYLENNHANLDVRNLGHIETLILIKCPFIYNLSYLTNNKNIILDKSAPNINRSYIKNFHTVECLSLSILINDHKLDNLKTLKTDFEGATKYIYGCKNLIIKDNYFMNDEIDLKMLHFNYYDKLENLILKVDDIGYYNLLGDLSFLKLKFLKLICIATDTLISPTLEFLYAQNSSICSIDLPNLKKVSLKNSNISNKLFENSNVTHLTYSGDLFRDFKLPKNIREVYFIDTHISGIPDTTFPLVGYPNLKNVYTSNCSELHFDLTGCKDLKTVKDFSVANSDNSTMCYMKTKILHEFDFGTFKITNIPGLKFEHNLTEEQKNKFLPVKHNY